MDKSSLTGELIVIKVECWDIIGLKICIFYLALLFLRDQFKCFNLTCKQQIVKCYSISLILRILLPVKLVVSFFPPFQGSKKAFNECLGLSNVFPPAVLGRFWKLKSGLSCLGFLMVFFTMGFEKRATPKQIANVWAYNHARQHSSAVDRSNENATFAVFHQPP